MLPKPKCPVIALEEHYWDRELAAQFAGGEGVRDADMLKRLYDLGELRLREMDEAGIDMQVISHGAPSAQKLSGADAVELTRRVNARLHAAVQDTLREWIERLGREAGDWPTKVTAFHPQMAVHGRYRQPCPVCGTPVQRIVHAENETNYCARCQTGGKLLADRSLSRLLKDDWPKTVDDL